MENTIKIASNIEMIVKARVELSLSKPYYIENKDRYYIKNFQKCQCRFLLGSLYSFVREVIYHISFAER